MEPCAVCGGDKMKESKRESGGEFAFPVYRSFGSIQYTCPPRPDVYLQLVEYASGLSTLFMKFLEEQAAAGPLELTSHNMMDMRRVFNHLARRFAGAFFPFDQTMESKIPLEKMVTVRCIYFPEQQEHLVMN